MSVLGIDASRHALDVVILQDDGPEAQWLRLPLTGDSVTSCRHLRSAFPRRTWLEDHGVWLAGLEDPYSEHANAAKTLGRLTGAVLALLPPEIEVRMIAPQSWRKEFLGTAKAAKEAVWPMLTEVWPGWYEAWLPELRRHHRRRAQVPLDAGEAYAIAHAARAIHEREEQQRAAEQAA